MTRALAPKGAGVKQRCQCRFESKRYRKLLFIQLLAVMASGLLFSLKDPSGAFPLYAAVWQWSCQI